MGADRQTSRTLSITSMLFIGDYWLEPLTSKPGPADQSHTSVLFDRAVPVTSRLLSRKNPKLEGLEELTGEPTGDREP